jgi:hypothetical protein
LKTDANDDKNNNKQIIHPQQEQHSNRKTAQCGMNSCLFSCRFIKWELQMNAPISERLPRKVCIRRCELTERDFEIRCQKTMINSTHGSFLTPVRFGVDCVGGVTFKNASKMHGQHLQAKTKLWAGLQLGRRMGGYSTAWYARLSTCQLLAGCGIKERITCMAPRYVKIHGQHLLGVSTEGRRDAFVGI